MCRHVLLFWLGNATTGLAQFEGSLNGVSLDSSAILLSYIRYLSNIHVFSYAKITIKPDCRLKEELMFSNSENGNITFGFMHKLPLSLERELANTLSRPAWVSKNEGIHERVNFSDTIWGFNLAGGAFYATPLRVTLVKKNSRAEHAGIKAGDVLRSINDIDTATLTVQEAHDIILECGLEIKLQLTAPDVTETTHYIYQDEIEDDLKEDNRLKEQAQQKIRRNFTGAKVNDAWSMAWPCNKKRDILYRESNCFLVPSKYEGKHPES